MPERVQIKPLPLSSTFQEKKLEQKITVSGKNVGKKKESEIIKLVKEYKRLMLEEQATGRGKVCWRIFRRIFAFELESDNRVFRFFRSSPLIISLQTRVLFYFLSLFSILLPSTVLLIFKQFTLR